MNKKRLNRKKGDREVALFLLDKSPPTPSLSRGESSKGLPLDKGGWRSQGDLPTYSMEDSRKWIFFVYLIKIFINLEYLVKIFRMSPKLLIINF